MYAGSFQFFYSLSIHFFKAVATANDHFGDLMFNDQVGTGRRFTKMCAGFKRNIQDALWDQLFVLLAYTIDSVHFGMCFPILPVITFPDDPVFVNKYSAYHGVGGCMACPQFCQLQAALHILFV